jgi:N-acetylmuramic acid 6-phosphate etherase
MVLTSASIAAYTLARMDLDGLVTEARGAEADLDLLSTRELVALINEQDATVAAAVGAVAHELAALVDEVAERLCAGGRLIYVGAGTSGGLAALDARECEATFGVERGRVLAIVAEDEAAEDDAAAGERGIAAHGVGPADAVVALSASGRTRFVVAAVRAAAAAGALTAGVVCSEGSDLGAAVDRELAIVVGPEVLAGSTRLKAGTAQKLVLNTLSTATMVRLGKTHGNLMVDVAATNEKLRARQRRIVEQATGAGREEAERALAEARGEAKVAIVALLTGTSVDEARARLAEHGGSVRRAAS